MKIFKTVIRTLVMLGISPNESCRFNWRLSIGFLVLSFVTLGSVMLMFSIENLSLMNLVEFFIVIPTMLEFGLGLATIALQRMELFEIIASMENLTNKSNLCPYPL